MGLDLVELVVRTEEDFGITIDDLEAGRIRTVGDLYHVICKLRDIAPHPNPDQLTAVASTKRSQASVQTTEGIWLQLVWIITDQLQVDRRDVRFNSTFRDPRR
jgi:hypothetical protein